MSDTSRRAHPSRRRWLRGAAGAGVVAATVAAETITRPASAMAGTDGDVVLGAFNSETTPTVITNTTSGGTAFQANATNGIGLSSVATGNGTGVVGDTDSGWGVQGSSKTGVGVQGSSPSGVGVEGSSPSGVGVQGSSPSGVGVEAYSSSGWGVSAFCSTNTALQAQSGSGNGVVGVSTSGAGVYGQSGNTNGFAVTRDAVRGFTDSATASGVRGENAGHGHGVSGLTTSNGSGGAAAVDGVNQGTGPGVRGIGGIGVLAEATGSGTALQVAGRAVFSRAGEATIKFPAQSATVSVPGGLAGNPLVLALLQTATPGVFVVSAVPNTSTGKITISLNKAPGTSQHPATAKVAWFVVN
jgi:hypothetical protein